jgi:hypothetical protein
VPLARPAWAVYLTSLKMDLKRKEVRLARTEISLKAARDSKRKELLGTQRKHWQRQIESLKMTINKIEAWRKDRKAMLK